MQWKKVRAVGFLAIGMAVTLCGCDIFSGKSESKLYVAESSENDSQTQTNVVSDESTVEETETETDEMTLEEKQASAAETVNMLGVGWSLGNALDAYDTSLGQTNDTETLFGNPVTTKEMIDMVADAGFDSVRIPVTYYNHMDENGTIDEAWLARVKEVVDYVIDDGMNCVINIHHDTGDSGWLKADAADLVTNQEKLNQMWTQIATYFAAYDSQLIFEGFNEILNSENAWSYAGSEAYDTANQLNQTFVDAVRATGGENAERYLIVNSYAASAEEEVLSNFVLPEDTADNRLIVGVHSYAGYDSLESMFTSLNNLFYSQGIPVLMGEFAIDRNADEEDRIAYAAYYAEHAMTNGIAYFWWDEGNYNQNSSSATDVCNYALFNRDLMEWAYPEIVDKLVDSTEN